MLHQLQMDVGRNRLDGHPAVVRAINLLKGPSLGQPMGAEGTVCSHGRHFLEVVKCSINNGSKTDERTSGNRWKLVQWSGGGGRSETAGDALFFLLNNTRASSLAYIIKRWV